MKNFFTKPIVLIGLAFLVAWVGFSEYKTWEKNKIIAEHIAILEQQEKDLRTKNIDLESQLKQVGTFMWQERAARTQLGLKRDGESVYVVSLPEQGEGQQDSTQIQTTESWYDNMSKWWEYLFEQPYEKVI